MSEFGNVQRAILPGLVSAVFVLGGGFGIPAVSAGSVGHSISSSTLPKLLLAQSSGQEAPDAPANAPTDPEAGVDDNVPFSELNEALAAARSRLAELTKAAEIAKVAGELRENLQAKEAENRQLKSVLSQLQTDYSALQATYQNAEGRIAELEELSEGALTEAKRLDEELASVRWQNSQLSNSLSTAETSAKENAEELTRVRDELQARDESLTAAAEESAIEIARLQRELDTAGERLLIAERQQAETATELVELRQASEEEAADSARLAQDLDGTITELANSRAELSVSKDTLQNTRLALEGAEQEVGVLREQLASIRSEEEQLRARLDKSENDLQRVRSINAGLEQQVDVLKTAAGDATDAARQNLLAVETQINEINAALASVKAEEFVPGLAISAETIAAASTSTQEASAQNAQGGSDGWVPRPSPPRATIVPELIAASAPDLIDSLPQPSPSRFANQPTGIGLPIESVEEDAGVAPNISLASLTTDLPASEREDAVALLDRLKAEEDERGLAMTVPGELLFAVDSEQIEPEAFSALANVAKLVDLYGQRDILIVGHTDAVGDATYNQRLSERRAALVKKYFIDEFEISEDRLKIEGKGEQDPIDSNATADGRNANRRVEVVILN